MSGSVHACWSCRQNTWSGQSCTHCGAQEVLQEEVTITDANGRILLREETVAFLKELQRGVMYLPQSR